MKVQHFVSCPPTGSTLNICPFFLQFLQFSSSSACFRFFRAVFSLMIHLSVWHISQFFSPFSWNARFCAMFLFYISYRMRLNETRLNPFPLPINCYPIHVHSSKFYAFVPRSWPVSSTHTSRSRHHIFWSHLPNCRWWHCTFSWSFSVPSASESQPSSA